MCQICGKEHKDVLFGGSCDQAVLDRIDAGRKSAESENVDPPLSYNTRLARGFFIAGLNEGNYEFSDS